MALLVCSTSWRAASGPNDFGYPESFKIDVQAGEPFEFPDNLVDKFLAMNKCLSRYTGELPEKTESVILQEQKLDSGEEESSSDEENSEEPEIYNLESLNSFSSAKLKEIAKTIGGIPNYGSMKKDDLVNVILERLAGEQQG